jgi:hypothetical protein
MVEGHGQFLCFVSVFGYYPVTVSEQILPHMDIYKKKSAIKE